eukprot:6199705-Pleurochrysis_carterae.AAC.1
MHAFRVQTTVYTSVACIHLYYLPAGRDCEGRRDDFLRRWPLKPVFCPVDTNCGHKEPRSEQQSAAQCVQDLVISGRGCASSREAASHGVTSLQHSCCVCHFDFARQTVLHNIEQCGPPASPRALCHALRLYRPCSPRRARAQCDRLSYQSNPPFSSPCLLNLL